MNEISQTTYTSSTVSQQAAGNTGSTTNTESTKASDGKVEVKGSGTYGSPKLSQKALDYYNSLTKKYGNLNFVLVSSDKKQQAESMKSSFASTGALTVLIDTDKIEMMAENESYRKMIEGTIDNAVNGISKLASSLGGDKNVKSYGMIVKDGTASLFAVIDKSLKAQKERIAKKTEKKREDQKVEAKKAEKKRAEKRTEEGDKTNRMRDEDTVTITANSIEELLQKIQDYEQNYLTDNVRTDDERVRGQTVDYSL